MWIGGCLVTSLPNVTMERVGLNSHNMQTTGHGQNGQSMLTAAVALNFSSY